MSTVILCRTCMLEMSLPEGQDVISCPACGTVGSRPVADADTCQMLARATRQRLHCDFMHAENSYQYVLRESPDEHEALWGVVQCRYGVEYVDDPKTGGKLPVVHTVRRRPMAADPDFRQACELAPEDVRAQYEQEGAYIDEAMARILQLSEGCRAYDVFLCHKTTRPGTDELTADYSRAFSIYHRLDKLGYRVFFAPEELSSAAGASYEAGIYHALHTARAMLVICSDAELLNSPWVRSEWQRFLEMSYESGADKRLIPLLYDSFPPRRLPVEFRHLQAIAMGELDATEKLLESLRSHLGAPQALQEPSPVPPVREQEPRTPAPPPAEKPEPPQTKEPDAPETVEFTPEGEFVTSLIGGGVAVTGYTGKSVRVAIPPMIGGAAVLEIAEGAFSFRRGVREVLLPKSVRHIRNSAFDGCAELTRVYLPQGLRSIGERAFADCDWLAQVMIPGSVEELGARAFSGCRGLQSLVLNEGVKHIGDWAFEDCRALAQLDLPAGLKSIGVGAFCSCCSLQAAVLPGSMESLGWCAFSDCNRLESVSLPASLTKIEDNPFQNSPMLTRIGVDPGNPVLSAPDGVLIADGRRLVCYPAGRKERRYAIPEEVTFIGARAFCGCRALTEVEFHSRIIDIGLAAFAGCTSLKLPLMIKLRFMGSKLFG